MMTNRLRVPLEIKSLAGREFEGYGSVFRTLDLGGDIVVPGAYRKTLADQKRAGKLPLMFWMHNPSQVPGKWLDMEEDERGLKVHGIFAKTALGDELHELTKMGAIRGLSIGYKATAVDWDKDGNRLLKQIELWETSLVSMPMNPDAEVEHVKSRVSISGEYVPTKNEMERALREVGFSHAWAKKFVANYFADEPRDEGVLHKDQSRDERVETEAAALRVLDTLCASLVKA
jgi:HK97 family phage prohead protease